MESEVQTLFLPDVEKLAGIKKNLIYSLMKVGKFPPNTPMRDVPSLRVWRKSDIVEWRNNQWVA